MNQRTLALVVAAGGVLSACGLNQQGVPPPADAIAFPGSALVDPTNGRWLYVANSNSDLRYNDGTLVAVDLTKARDDRQARSGAPTPVGDAAGGASSADRIVWKDCPSVNYVHPRSDPDRDFCCWDLLDRNILNCDERRYIPPQATVRIGSFASGMVWQHAKCGPPAADGGASGSDTTCDEGCGANPPAGRLLVGIRGNTSVTYADIRPGQDEPQIDCGAGGGDIPECDEQHRVKTTAPLPSPTDATPVTLLPDEPYALALDEPSHLLYVGHLKGDILHPDTGGISLFDVANAASGRPPVFIAPFPAVFPADGNGLFGVTSLTVNELHKTPSDPDPPPQEIFATSRYVPRTVGVRATRSSKCGQATARNEVALVGTGDSFDTTLIGAEVRGIQFLPDQPRAFVLQRVPPALVGFDIATNEQGGLRFTPTDVLETCGSPTFLQMHNAGNAGVRLFVTCFESGQVYVVDPYVPRITNIIEVGRGPAGLVFGPEPGDAGAGPGDPFISTRAYVVGFGENSIGVVDLLPGSATEFRVVQRIGFPSVMPR